MAVTLATLGRVKSVLGKFVDAGLAWRSDRIPRLSAALAFYTLFSLAPLLAICLSLLGWIYDRKSLQEGLVAEIGKLVGSDAAQAIAAMVAGTDKPAVSLLVSAVGFVVLVFSAIGVFVELKDALNAIWKVTPRPGGGVWGFVRDYLAPMTMVLGIGFLLLVSLLVSAGLSAMSQTIDRALPFGGALLWIIDTCVSFSVIAILFGMIYKILPDLPLSWSDIWSGAAVASGLFMVGRYLIGLYLGKAGLTSTYGAAGSLVAILIWVYYSAQILYYGAEFARVHAGKKLPRDGE